MSEIITTTADCEVLAWVSQGPAVACRMTIPAGTRAKLIDEPQGVAWVVDDVPLLVSLSGNTHDPHCRYVYLPLKAFRSQP